MKGWVYIATMSNTVGVVKIGYSDRDPEIRVNEWGRDTGAPGTPEVKYAALVVNAKDVEKSVHESLSSCRQSSSEWFQCEVSDGVLALKQHAKVIYEDDRIAAAEAAERKHILSLQRAKYAAEGMLKARELEQRVERLRLQREAEKNAFLKAQQEIVRKAEAKADAKAKIARAIAFEADQKATFIGFCQVYAIFAILCVLLMLALNYGR